MTPKQCLPKPYVLQFKYKVVFKFRMFSPFIYLIFADMTSEKTAQNTQDYMTQIHFQKTSQFLKKVYPRKKTKNFYMPYKYLIYSGTFDTVKM